MFTLAVDNVVKVPVKFSIKEGAVNKSFSMTLTATRYTAQERELMSAGLTNYEFMLDAITDWSDQRLVLNSAGEPAEFSLEALKYLFGVPGVFEVTLASYLRECAGKEKN